MREKYACGVMVFSTLFLMCACASDVSEDRNTQVDETVVNVDETEYQYPIVLEPSIDGSIYFAALSDDIFLICGEDKYGYIKVSGDEITDYEYEVAYPFSEGVAYEGYKMELFVGFYDNFIICQRLWREKAGNHI